MIKILGKIGAGLLYPFAELAGWLVMRGLRKWAASYQVDTPFPQQRKV